MNSTNSANIFKISLTAALATLSTMVIMWLSLSATAVTRAEAQRMIDDRLTPLQRIERKQDTMQDSVDDVRERLARIEERMDAQEKTRR